MEDTSNQIKHCKQEFAPLVELYDVLRELEEEYEEPDEDHIDRSYLIFPPAEYCPLLASLAGDAHRQQIDLITSLEEQALSMMKSIFESQDVTVMTDAPFQLLYAFSSPFVTVQQYRSGEYILKRDDRCATKVWTHKDDPTINTSWLSFSQMGEITHQARLH